MASMDLFDATSRQSIRERLIRLEPECVRQWGKMNPAQMMAHCSMALEMASGDRPLKQKLIGKFLAPLVKGRALGEVPFDKNLPTHPTFVIADDRDFGAEKARLEAMIEKFAARGRDAAGNETHAFFGRLTGAEWGRMMYKHLDHHFRQFGI